jgi:hypothetical protein
VAIKAKSDPTTATMTTAKMMVYEFFSVLIDMIRRFEC